MALTQTTASANRVLLALAEETAFGVFPTTPALQNIRMTGETLAATEATTRSSEIRADRQVPDVVRTNFGAAGAINYEAHHPIETSTSTALLDLIKGAMFQASPTAQGATQTVTASISTGGNITITVGSLAGGGVGRYVKIANFTNAVNNGVKRITTWTSPTDFVVEPGTGFTAETDDADVELTLLGYIPTGTDWCAFSIERDHQDFSTKPYAHFTGMTVDQWSMDFPVDGIVTGSFQLLGKDESVRAASTLGGSNVAATGTSILNSIQNDNTVRVAGVDTEIVSMAFQLQNNLRQRQVTGTLGPTSVGEGSVNVTGNIRFFLADTGTVDDLFIPDTRVAVSRVLEDAAGNAQVFDYPKVKFTAMPRGAEGLNQDVQPQATWEAYRDPTLGYTFGYHHYTAP